jgi:hypothetical protein
MSESGLKVVIAPVITDADRQAGLAAGRMLVDMICGIVEEMREEGNDECIGDSRLGLIGADFGSSCDLAGMGILEGIG